jgi:predicted metal-dependent phosphoesterase TrpH
MGLVDLHLHSNRSDGEYAPAEVVRLAARAGLRVIALTDHDTTDGIAEAIAEAAAVNAETAAVNTETAAVNAETGAPGAGATAVNAEVSAPKAEATAPAAAAAAPDTPQPRGPLICLTGIEITTAHAREQHILGYHIDYESEPFRAFTKRLMALRHEREGNILDYLRGKGVRISYGQVRKISGSDYVGRPHIAYAMVRMGKVSSIQEAFLNYLTGDEFHKVPRPKPSVEESIASIRKAGGTAVLAHPGTLGLDAAELEARLKTLKGLGLGGLECHYGIYDRARTQDYIRLAGKLGLIVTGGSDFHGPRVKPGVLIATGKDGMLDYNDTGVADRLRSAR